MFFYIKGYNLSTCTLKKLQKDKYVLSKEIKEQVSKEELVALMRKILTNQGKVYFFTKKKEVRGIIVIGYEKHMAVDFDNMLMRNLEEQENSDNEKNVVSVNNLVHNIMEQTAIVDEKFATKKDREKIKFANAYVLKGLYLDDTLKEKENEISEGIIEELKEVAALNSLSVKVFIWNDKVVMDNMIGKSSSSAISLGMLIGAAIGTSFGMLSYSNHGNVNYILMGLLFGISIGTSIGATYYSIGKKKDMQ